MKTGAFVLSLLLASTAAFASVDRSVLLIDDIRTQQAEIRDDVEARNAPYDDLSASDRNELLQKQLAHVETCCHGRAFHRRIERAAEDRSVQHARMDQVGGQQLRRRAHGLRASTDPRQQPQGASVQDGCAVERGTRGGPTRHGFARPLHGLQEQLTQEQPSFPAGTQREMAMLRHCGEFGTETARSP